VFQHVAIDAAAVWRRVHAYRRFPSPADPSGMPISGLFLTRSSTGITRQVNLNQCRVAASQAENWQKFLTTINGNQGDCPGIITRPSNEPLAVTEPVC